MTELEVTKPSREDVLRIAVETGFIRGPEVEGRWLASFERFAAAIYDAGAEAAADEIKALKYSLRLDEELIGMIQKIITVLNNRPVPITTNTEGEQG